MEKIGRAGARLFTLADDDYPPRLRELPDAPPVLYVRGSITAADTLAVALVGTRNATRYGRDVAHDLAGQLARNGITIVSGLALGIDAAAHRGALDASAPTIAVLGCGIERIYPGQNRDLAERMIETGAIISEFPIGTPPEGRNFPIRNRIISGLALGVLVVEAPENSGAIITATIAAEQGREVFAVPHNVYNQMGRGTNRLIQDGAKLVMDVADILDELNLAQVNVQTRIHTERVVPANAIEAALLGQLSTDPIHIDDLVRACELPISIVSSTLTILELKGLAQMVGHMQYSLTTRKQ
jgi:DNA processing protein